MYQFCDFIQDKPITVRFIELMQTGNNLEYFKKYHVGSELIQQQLLGNGWEPVIREKTAGPAIEYQHKNYLLQYFLLHTYLLQ